MRKRDRFEKMRRNPVIHGPRRRVAMKPPPTLTGVDDEAAVAAYIEVDMTTAADIVRNLPDYRPMCLTDNLLFPAWTMTWWHPVAAFVDPT